MPLDLVTTGYGRPASQALGTAIAAAKAGQPLAPVTVVVPSNHVGVTARRLLASGAAGPVCRGGAGVAGVRFLTTYRLAELLGSARLAAGDRRPVSTPVIAAALRRALADDAGVLTPVAHHPATESALVGAFTELSDLADDALDAVAGAGRRARDVVRLCRAARAHLTGAWYDETALTTGAVEAVVAGDPLVDDIGHVVVHLVQDLSRRQARLLQAVGDRCPTTAVAALTGVPEADAGVHRSLDRLGCKTDLPGPRAGDRRPGVVTGVAPPVTTRPSVSPCDGAGTPTAEAELPVDAQHTRILTASDADDEVRAAVRGVLDAARRGVPLERVAVLFGASEPYGRLLHEHLDAAGIARNGTAVRALAASAVGRLVLDLLALPDRRYRRRDVLGLLARSALRTPEGAPVPTAEWERLSREAGVVAGRADWSDLLERLAGRLDQRADDLDAADPPVHTPAAVPGADGEAVDSSGRGRSHADHLRRRATQARSLRATVLTLVDELTTAAAAAQPWRDRVRWLRRLTDRLLGNEPDRAAWPGDEHRAAEKIDAALHRLSALDGIDQPPTLEVFRRTLDLELEADLGRVGCLGEGVLVAPLGFAAGLDLDLVVVVGLAEGTLPGRVRDDSLLPDAERRRTGGHLPLRRERVARDHRHLRAALAGARSHLLCAPRGDLRASNERVPSRWLLAVASALHGGPVSAEQLARLQAPWLDHVPSFAHAVTHARFPSTEQDYRLRAGPRRAPDAIATAGAAVIAARRSPAFTRFDGNLAGAALPTPAQGTTSPTRLEAWATCPHAYFVRYVLGVQPLDDPERQLAITPLDRGSLVHDVLERFVRARVERGAAGAPRPDEGWTSDDHAAMAALAARICDDYEARGLTGRPVFWRRDRAQIIALADRFLREDEAHRRATGTRPIAVEVTFGRPGGHVEPVDVPLDDGRTVRFSGAVDRIDRAGDGALHVTDYKTGSARNHRSLRAEDPDQRGTKLQLAIYAHAARATHGRPDTPVQADYWFVSDREGFTRQGYVVDDDVMTRVSATLTTVVTGIEQGLFPARPEDSGVGWVTCPYCDPDGLGVSELRRAWERKRHAPQVAPYAALAEPLVDAQTAEASR